MNKISLFKYELLPSFQVWLCRAKSRRLCGGCAAQLLLTLHKTIEGSGLTAMLIFHFALCSCWCRVCFGHVHHG